MLTRPARVSAAESAGAAFPLAERLRGQATTRAVPLVALASGEDLGPGAALFSECLSRPVDRRLLAAALKRLGVPVP